MEIKPYIGLAASKLRKRQRQERSIVRILQERARRAEFEVDRLECQRRVDALIHRDATRSSNFPYEMIPLIVAIITLLICAAISKQLCNDPSDRPRTETTHDHAR